jgi:hypothetical protein
MPTAERFFSGASSVGLSVAPRYFVVDLARKAARWAADNAERIGAADPDLPPGIFNREADNWRPLFSIAAVAGGDWPERTRCAEPALTGNLEDSLVF